MTSNTHNPKVSVLTPVYNTNTEYLRQCIESILNQTFTDFEFLLLNDSPENVAIEQTIKSFADPRIKYYSNKQNMGISYSRNMLLDLAQGEYIATFDHDDISHPDRLKKEVNFLEQHPHIGIVGSLVQYFKQDINENGHVASCPQYDNDIRVMLTESCYVAHTSILIRSQILKQHGLKYRAYFSPCEDYQLFNELLDVTKFHVLQEILVYYRIHDARTSNVQHTTMNLMSKTIKLDIRNKYPAHRIEYLKKSKRTLFSCTLLGFIPLLKVKKGYIWLFNCIPIIKINWH